MLAQLLQRLAFLTPLAGGRRAQRGRAMGRLGMIWAGLVLVHGGIATTHAQSGGHTARPAAPLPTLRAQLLSGDPKVAEAALDARLAEERVDGARRGGQFRPVDEALWLTEFLAAGQPDDLTHKALRRLGALTVPAAQRTLLLFTAHHRAAVRRVALTALAARTASAPDHVRRLPDEDREARNALEDALGDRDHAVRAAAARSLHHIGAGPSLARLWAAFDAGVPEAAEGIGAAGDAQALERFHGYLETRPLSTMLIGYQAFLASETLAMDAKRGIVLRLREVGSRQSRVFLQAYLRTMPNALRQQSPEWVTFVAKAIAAIDVDASAPGRRRQGEVRAVGADDDGTSATTPESTR